MAHLEVKPKSSRPWWLWLLLALVALAIIIALFRSCSNEHSTVTTTDSTANSTTMNDTSNEAGNAVAATGPDWKSVDFNSPATPDPDITDKDISVSGNDQYTIYTLGENILFAKDQNSIQQNAEQKLKTISGALNKHFKDGYIGVFGSTDSTGTAGHNKALGADRAAAVKDWLVSNGNIPDNRLSIHSFGEAEPVAPNATKAGRAQNRNVQIVVFKGGNAEH